MKKAQSELEALIAESAKYVGASLSDPDYREWNRRSQEVVYEAAKQLWLRFCFMAACQEETVEPGTHTARVALMRRLIGQ